MDDRAAFVTSANLTEAAFDRNFEVGILLRDPRWLPRSRATSARYCVGFRCRDVAHPLLCATWSAGGPR